MGEGGRGQLEVVQRSGLRCGSNVFRRLLEEQGVRVVDFGKHGPLPDWWDGPVVVHVKHPVSYVVSLRRFFGVSPLAGVERWWDVVRHPRRGVSKWHGRDLANLAHHISQGLYGERCMLVRYEDLVADPEEVVGGVVRELGGVFDGCDLPEEQVYPEDGPVDHTSEPPFDPSYYTEERWREDASRGLVEGVWQFIEWNGLRSVFEAAGYTPGRG